MRSVAVLILVLFPMSIIISDDSVKSGPKVGDKLEGFKADGVLGSVEGKEVDYFKERKGEPTVFMFVSASNFGRPAYRSLKAVDADLPEGSKGVAIWLNEKKEDGTAFLNRASKSLNFGKTDCGVFGDVSGPNGWGINSDAHVTVVITHEGKAKAVFAFKTINETDAKKIVEATTKLKEKK